MPDRSRCPKCGERVSPYAAGCAICGTDLDTQRWDSGPGALNRLGSWFSSLGMGPDRGGPWVLLVLVIFLMFGGSILAALYALFA
jgi:hypothetical protein